MTQRTQVVDAGGLNRRIPIQQQQPGVQDALGQPSQIWTTIYCCWASIDVQHSQLLYETAEFVGKNTLRITIRYTSSYVFNRGDRIQYVEQGTSNTHIYEIQSIINPDQRNRMIVFLCYEINPEE